MSSILPSLLDRPFFFLNSLKEERGEEELASTLIRLRSGDPVVSELFFLGLALT